MAKKSPTNLVGRTVLIDWPMRWKQADEKYQAQLRAEAEENEHLFGKLGEITAYNQGDESGRELVVLVDGQLHPMHYGSVTITGAAPNPEAEIIALLKQIEYNTRKV